MSRRRKIPGYKKHMTDEYDERFKEAKDLEWYPWVGKDYHKTGVFILGMSTYSRGSSSDKPSRCVYSRELLLRLVRLASRDKPSRCA